MSDKYTIGLDFGTLSVRAVLVSVNDGTIVAESVNEYANGVITEKLPGTDIKLPDNYALQNADDYMYSMICVIKDIVSITGSCNISTDDIIGIGTDFTSCTIFPVMQDGTPLSSIEKYKNIPHSYVKLWKHHAAQKQADRMTDLANEMHENWLERYGGKVSCEWMIPKIMEIEEECPEIYDECDYIIEAGDWIVWMLTGVQKRSACMAGYKACWSKNSGYPDEKYLAALNPKFDNLISEKLDVPIIPTGSFAGTLCGKMAEKLGLKEGIAVCSAVIDAHSALPALKISREGQMLSILGTSACYMMLGNREITVKGICGYVDDGIIPGFIGYEAGQSCYGDHFQYFIDNMLPSSYHEEAKNHNMSDIQYITVLAEKLKPGESGLICLDWWNGNRSILVDSDLEGMILGITLSTKPEEIFRAIVEATAFGARKIFDNFEKYGVNVDELFACGGIAEKNKFIVQLLSDITGKNIRISGCSQASALGASIYAACSAGKEAGGYSNMAEASEKMGKLRDDIVYTPNKKAYEVYSRIYEEYIKLHDYFGCGENNVMKRLKAIKNTAK